LRNGGDGVMIGGEVVIITGSNDKRKHRKHKDKRAKQYKRYK